MSKEKKSKMTKSKGVGSIKLKGWRKFKDEINVELGRVNFLMGPNNAGKTSFLSAFRFISLMSQEGWPIVVPKKLKRRLEENLLNSESEDGSMSLKFGNSMLSFQFSERFADLSISDVILSNGSFRIESLLSEEHRMTREYEEGRGPFLIGDITSDRSLTEVGAELKAYSNDFLTILEKLKGFEASPNVLQFLTSLKIDVGLVMTDIDDFFFDYGGSFQHQSLGQIPSSNGIWYIVMTNRYYLEVVYFENGFEGLDPDVLEELHFNGEVPNIDAWDGLWASKNWDRWPVDLRKGASSPFGAMLQHVVPGNEESSLGIIQEAFGKWRFNLETTFMYAQQRGMPMVSQSRLRSLTSDYSALAHSLWYGVAFNNYTLPSVCNSIYVDSHPDQLSLRGTYSDDDLLNVKSWSRRIREFYTTDFLSDFMRDVLWIPPGSSELQNSYSIDSSPFPNFFFREQDAYLDRDKREMDFELSRCLMYLGFGGGFRLIRKKSANVVQLALRELDAKQCSQSVSLLSIRKSNNTVFKEGGRGWLSDGRVSIDQMGRATSNLIWLMLTLMEAKLAGTSKIVVLEEPGAFMHPRIASRFTDVIRHLAEFLELIVFVETHNEYMIRQLSTSRLKGDDLEDVRIHYFGAPGKEGVMPIKVDKDGVFTPAIPDGFLDKSSSMMREQRELKRKRDTK